MQGFLDKGGDEKVQGTESTVGKLGFRKYLDRSRELKSGVTNTYCHRGMGNTWDLIC